MMSLPVLLLGGVVGILLLLFVAIVVPASTAKGWAVTISLIAGAIVINNSVPAPVWGPVGLLLMALLVIGAARGGLRMGWHAGSLLLVIWLTLAAFSALISRGIGAEVVGLYFGLLLLLGVTVTALSRREVRLVLRGILILACLEVFLAALEFVFRFVPLWGYRGGLMRENPFIDGIVRDQGTFGHPLVMGYFMAVVGVIAWNGAAAGLRRGPRVALLMVIAAGLLLSGTRSAVLACLTGILVHTLMRSHLTSWFRNIILIASLAIVVYLQSVNVSRLVTDLLDSGSWTHRLNSLGSVDALLARETGEMLWGSGWGTEVSLYDRGLIPMSFGLKVVDNFVVYVLGTMGVIGLLLLAITCVVIFIRADSLGKALVVVSVTMFFSFDIVVWFFGGMLMVFSLTLPKTDRANRSRRTSASRSRALASQTP
ncbi:hypothetical protein D9V32_00270 [Mycetocola tolaasinivorans]|uniref:O-antigen ligase domain-containing protein n=1 Tax=Mycetocola tolaasinivorans TaxID=76635 RepID=A0A3L7ABD5_9MICO|nr:hypothetical protein [Mycetocola tolaasinivorans]RLP77806.1 hypothetical protein D9V32_00270 [Mycetocola tolaasinivorans]